MRVAGPWVNPRPVVNPVEVVRLDCRIVLPTHGDAALVMASLEDGRRPRKCPQIL